MHRDAIQETVRLGAAACQPCLTPVPRCLGTHGHAWTLNPKLGGSVPNNIDILYAWLNGAAVVWHVHTMGWTEILTAVQILTSVNGCLCSTQQGSAIYTCSPVRYIMWYVSVWHGTVGIMQQPCAAAHLHARGVAALAALLCG